MTAGLRERADMQKFVSQSTVDDDPARARHRAAQAGARQVITLLFCRHPRLHRLRRAAPARRGGGRAQPLSAAPGRPGHARFDGDVDKFIGDAVFAHFTGADMALDAIRCAVEIHRAVAAASADDPGLPPLAVGVGIATGEVIVGSIGSADRLDYTAIGAAVNLARGCARVPSRARP